MTTSPVMGITEEILGEIERAGWKLVPVEPTREMLVAINWPNDPAGYRAMLAAAPEYTAQEDQSHE